MDLLRVGLMGLGRGGQGLADALRASSWCELVAAASPRADRRERFAERCPQVAVVDDFRSLIVGYKLDALFVAVPPFLRGKYLKLAAERGLAVWMMTPAAAGLGEAVELLRLFEAAEAPIVVSRSWGVEPGLQPELLGLSGGARIGWWRGLDGEPAPGGGRGSSGNWGVDRHGGSARVGGSERPEGSERSQGGTGDEGLGRLFFGWGHVMTCWAEDFGWRGDSVRAGGGVLLDRGYAVVDTIVEAMGLPVQVQAMTGAVSRPGGHYPYDTEDTAVLVMRFADGAVANVTACWTSGPEEAFVELHGTGGSARIDRRVVVVRDRAGRPSGGGSSPGTSSTGATSPGSGAGQARPGNVLLPQVEQFLGALCTGAEEIAGGLRDHLRTMAVIEAAYLSARTGQPESPRGIFEMHDLDEGER